MAVLRFTGTMILLFSVTALTGALLMFWVEPLFARLILPLLGGSPAVWNTCLMYFQVMLLCGYLYAHGTSRYLGARRQALLHVGLLALSLLALPVAIPEGWAPPASGSPVPWLLMVLTLGLGAPFFTLSAAAPLLQRWVASLDHPTASDPYRLYAASNAGSFLGLLAFPFLFEPALRLAQQRTLWSVGYLVVAGLMAGCAFVVWRFTPSRAGVTGIPPGDSAAEPPPFWGERARWVALAFVPSSLLLGVTTYLTTDVAAVPFLWVLPLAIYLLTFVAAFGRRDRSVPRVPLELHALLVTVFAVVVFWDIDLDQLIAYPLHLGVFTITAFVLHGELAARRPAPRYLTEFYLWLALGGAMGGTFNAIVAPILFDSVLEYVPMVVAACFLRPGLPVRTGGRVERLQMTATALLPALLLAVVVAFGVGGDRRVAVPVAVAASVLAALIAITVRHRSAWFGISLGAMTVASLVLLQRPTALRETVRSFFGAYRVMETRGVRMLYHGTTIHGAQFTDSARRSRPLTYYHQAGPVGQLFDAFGGRLQGRSIGVVGLGAGSLLCYGKAGQDWRFFEIDPLVERIARTPAYFTFLRDCPVRARVILGDARLTLSREPPGRYALLVLDAFSSDAIPVHLLTREAFTVYRRALAPDGVLLVHVSNKHLDLEPVVAGLAADAGMVGLIAEHSTSDRQATDALEYGSDWIVMTSRAEHAGPLQRSQGWRRLTVRRAQPPWTDDYSNIFRAIRW